LGCVKYHKKENRELRQHFLTYEENRPQLRDPYNRKQRLTYWIHRIEGDFDGADRDDEMTFVNHMKYNANSALRVLLSATALISMRKMIGTSFRDCTTEGICKFIDIIEYWMNYKPSTIEKYKKILKHFYKVVYGKNEFYPEQLKRISIKVLKDKARESFSLDNADYLGEEEIRAVVASTVQRKAIISCMYGSGARLVEFLMLQNTK